MSDLNNSNYDTLSSTHADSTFHAGLRGPFFENGFLEDKESDFSEASEPFNDGSGRHLIGTHSLSHKDSALRSLLREALRKQKLWTPGRWERLTRGYDLLITDQRKRLKPTSFFKVENQFYYETCGLRGELLVGRNSKGEREERYNGWYCNFRRACIPCAKRYHAGRGYMLLNKVEALYEAGWLRKLLRVQFTLPKGIRNHIVTESGKEGFLFLRRKAAEAIQQAYDCGMRKGKRINGTVGIEFLEHWTSSSESWKDSPHLHALVVAVKIFKDEAGKPLARSLPVWIPHQEIKVIWRRALLAYCEKYELKPKDLGIPDEALKIVVNLQCHDLSNKRERATAFNGVKYDARLLGIDLLKAVKLLDFKQGLAVLGFKDKVREIGYWELWTLEELAERLRKMLQKHGHTMQAYGWFKNFSRYLDLFGLVEEPVDDSFEQEDRFKLDITRGYTQRKQKHSGRLQWVKRILVRIRDWDTGDLLSGWYGIDVSQLRGESHSFNSRVVWYTATG